MVGMELYARTPWPTHLVGALPTRDLCKKQKAKPEWSGLCLQTKLYGRDLDSLLLGHDAGAYSRGYFRRNLRAYARGYPGIYSRTNASRNRGIHARGGLSRGAGGGYDRLLGGAQRIDQRFLLDAHGALLLICLFDCYGVMLCMPRAKTLTTQPFTVSPLESAPTLS